MGLPLFNRFIGEWMILRSFIGGSTLVNTNAQLVLPLMVGVLALIGGLAAACFVRVYGVAFLGRPRSTEAENAKASPRFMRVGTVLLAAACVALASGRALSCGRSFPLLKVWLGPSMLLRKR